MNTTADVFIVESLRFEDEERDHFEGEFLAHILRLADRQVRYYYIRTRAELDEVLDRFEDSGFRYLHLSCHADTSGIALTLDHLSVAELAQVLGPVLAERRVFFSACEIATPELANALLKDTNCYSLVGPSKAVRFDESALFWASLYHLLFKAEAHVVKREDLKNAIKQVSAVFDLGVRYFTGSRSAASGYTEVNCNR
jgi:hypothetical protein